MPCTTADEKDLIRLLDAERYAEPGTLCSSSCRQALEWSDWETQLSKAMYELLRHLENVLRSAITARLAVHYGRDDWWNAPRLRLTYSTREKIEDAKDKLVQDTVPVTPAAIQRRVTLGFWVSLMGRGADYETQLWRPMSAGFPGYHGRREPLHAQLDHLRSLRNKVAHQEPIGGRGQDLAVDRRSVLTAIGYVSKGMAQRADTAGAAIQALLASRPGICAQRRVGGS